MIKLMKENVVKVCMWKITVKSNYSHLASLVCCNVRPFLYAVCEFECLFLLGIQAFIEGHQCSVQGGGNARVGLDAEQEVVQG